MRTNKISIIIHNHVIRFLPLNIVGVLLVLSINSNTSALEAGKWSADVNTVNDLVILPLGHITHETLDLIPKDERVSYALAAGAVLVFEKRNFEKAKAYLKLIEEMLESDFDVHQATAMYALYTTLYAMQSRHTDVVFYGEKAFELISLHDNVAIELHADLSRSLCTSYYTLGRYREGLAIAEKFAQNAEASGNILFQAEAYFDMAECQCKLGNLDHAKKAANRARELYGQLQHDTGLGGSAKVLGNIYFGRGENDEAIRMYKLAIVHYEKVDNAHGLGNCYFNVGLVYKSNRQWDEASEQFRISSFQFMQSGSPGGAGMAKMELANVYSIEGSFNEAALIFSEARDLLVRTNSMDRLAQLEGYVGDMYFKSNDIRSAEEAYHKSLALYQETGNHAKIRMIEQKIRSLADK